MLRLQLNTIIPTNWPAFLFILKTIQSLSQVFFNFLVCLFYIFLATLHSMWDLISLTKDQTHAPCIRSAES